MKQACIGIIVAGVFLVAGHAVLAQGMMAADRAAVEKAIMANENKINDAFAKRDVATMKMFIADDAMAVDPTGGTMVADFFKQLPTMDIKITEQSSSNFKYLWVDANTVVVSYTWMGKGSAMGQPVTSPTYSSTVWTKRGAKWLAVFHQETGAAPMGAMPMGTQKK